MMKTTTLWRYALSFSTVLATLSHSSHYVQCCVCVVVSLCPNGGGHTTTARSSRLASKFFMQRGANKKNSKNRVSQNSKIWARGTKWANCSVNDIESHHLNSTWTNETNSVNINVLQGSSQLFDCVCVRCSSSSWRQWFYFRRATDCHLPRHPRNMTICSQKDPLQLFDKHKTQIPTLPKAWSKSRKVKLSKLPKNKSGVFFRIWRRSTNTTLWSNLSIFLSPNKTGISATCICHFEDGTSVTEKVVDNANGKISFEELSNFTSLPAMKEFDAEVSVKPVITNKTDLTFTLHFQPKYGFVGKLIGKYVMKPKMKELLCKMWWRVLPNIWLREKRLARISGLLQRLKSEWMSKKEHCN